MYHLNQSRQPDWISRSCLILSLELRVFWISQRWFHSPCCSGGNAGLPCDLVPSQPGDSVYLVLWYRQDDKTPIYSYDSRTGSPELWSEPSVFGQRAVFRDYNGARPAVLAIKEISKENDEGISS